ncbi:MAG: DUF5658 family protein [Candidatus Aminicenantales bacterium]
MKKNKLLGSIIFFTLITGLVFTCAWATEEDSSVVVKTTENENQKPPSLFTSQESKAKNSIEKEKILFQIQHINAEQKIEKALEPQKPHIVYEPNRILKNHLRAQSLNKGLYTGSLVMLLGLNIADYLTTREALKYSGLKEGNPLLAGMAKNPAIFAVAKIGIGVTSFYVMKKMYKKNKELAWIVSLAANFALSYVVYNNLRLINQNRAEIN